MTRIVHSSGEDEGRFHETIQKEVRGAVGRGIVMQKIRGCCGCFLIVILLCIGLFSLGSYGVAKTGLVDVPVFSKFFTKPAASRIVLSTNIPLVESIEKQLRDQVVAIAASSMISAPRMSVLLREEELTRGLQDVLFGIQDDSFRFDQAQVAVEDEYIELFASFTFHDEHSTLRLWVLPELKDGHPTIKIQKVTLGELRVWHRPVNFFMQNLITNQLKSVYEMIDGVATIEQFTFRRGVIELVGEVTGSLDFLK